MLSAIQGFSKNQLKTTETKVTTTLSILSQGKIEEKKKLPKRICILLVTQNYPSFKFLSEEIEKVLLTSVEVFKLIKEEDKKAFLDIESVASYSTSGLVEWHALELHGKYNFTHVVSHGEEDLIRAARIRESLKISFGQTVQSAIRYRDKVIMKQIAASKGIRVPTFATVENANDLIRFIKESGYPVVVKPRKGYGSVNTSVLKSEEDLKNLLANSLNPFGFDAVLDLEVEKFVHGQMYHIDGIVFGGEVKAIWPSRYTNTVVDYQSNRYIAGYSLRLEDPLVLRLQQFIVDTIEALGGPSCFPFHAEAWHTPEDEIVLCEIASRTGGGGIREEVFELFDIRLDKTWTQAQCEDFITNETLSTSWKERKPVVDYQVGWIFIYPQKGQLVSLPKECNLDYVVGYVPLAKPGEIFKTRASCADAVANVLVKGKSDEEVVSNINRIYDWFNQQCEWETL